VGIASVKLAGLQPGIYEVTMRQVGYQHNDVFSGYKEIGSPLNLTRAQLAKLQGLQRDEPVKHESVVVEPGKVWQRDVTLRQNDCVLLTITKSKGNRLIEMDQHQAKTQ
jgi:beta-xylosidase